MLFKCAFFNNQKGTFPDRVVNTKSESGSVVVEFALVATVLFTILFCILEMGLLINTRLVITAAAREGARRAAVDGGASQAAYDRIYEELSMGNIIRENASVVITPKTAAYGSYVRVLIEYDYPIITPVVRNVIGKSVILKGFAVSRSEKIR